MDDDTEEAEEMDKTVRECLRDKVDDVLNESRFQHLLYLPDCVKEMQIIVAVKVWKYK